MLRLILIYCDSAASDIDAADDLVIAYYWASLSDGFYSNLEFSGPELTLEEICD